MARLTIRLLGGFEVRSATGERLALPTRKSEALLAYLALAPGRPHARDKLTALLWSDTADRQARQSLRQALFSLRKTLASGSGPALLVEENDAIALDAAAVDVDVAGFERLGRSDLSDDLERAVALYQGDLLAGIPVRSAGFEEWLRAERERLHELALATMARHIARLTKTGALERAIEAAVRLLAIDPLQEAVHRALLRLYVRAGRQDAALRQYQLCADVLRRELNAEPEPETRALYQDLLRQRPSPAALRPRPAPAQSPGTPLVGRETELARLHDARDAAWRSGGAALILVGEAGVGKSRLAEALIADSRAADGTVLVGRAYEMESVLPFAPWVDALRHAASINAFDDLVPDARRQLALLLPELDREQAPGAEGSANPMVLFDAVTQALASLASSRSLLVVVEDVHAADEMSLRLFAFLARRLHGAPVLLLATARAEELPGTVVLSQVVRELEHEGRLTRLDLPRLGRGATVDLVRALAGKADRHTRLAERVWQWSGGNPFMVVECMLAIGAAGPPRAPASLPLPQRVREMVAGRLERLTGRTAQLLAIAAVLGHQFTFPVLVRAAGFDEATTAEALEELVRRRVLRASAPGFDFDHERIREVAYERLLPERRQVLHAAAAAALRAIHAGALDDVHDQLAHHYRNAGLAEEAIAALVEVAAAARRRYALNDAIRVLDEALALVDRLPAAARPRQTIELKLQQAPHLAGQTRYADGLALLLPHQDEVDQLGEPMLSGPFYFRLALLAAAIGHHDDTARFAERACAAAERAGDAATLGGAHYALAVSAFSTKPRECVEQASRAIELLEGTPERITLCRAWRLRALGLFMSGEFTAALEASAQVEPIAAAAGDPGLTALAALTTAWIHVTAGDLSAATAAAERATRGSYNRYIDAAARGVLGYARVLSAADRDGIALITDARALLPRRDAAYVILGVFLSDVYARFGDRAGARKTAEEALDAARETRLAWGIASAQRALGRLAASSGERATARGHFEDALAGFRAMPAPFESATTLLDLAALEAAGDPPTARAYIAEARQAFAALGLDSHVQRADAIAAGLPSR